MNKVKVVAFEVTDTTLIVQNTTVPSTAGNTIWAGDINGDRCYIKHAVHLELGNHVFYLNGRDQSAQYRFYRAGNTETNKELVRISNTLEF